MLKESCILIGAIVRPDPEAVLFMSHTNVKLY